MPRVPARLAAAAALCALLPLAASADPTPEQAAGLQQALRGWLAHAIGPEATIPGDFLHVEPQGDHYRVSIALGALPGILVTEGGTITASALPLSAGRWVVYDQRLPSPTRLTLDLPVRATKSGEAGGPLDVTVKVEKSAADAILDPSFATPSTLNTAIQGYDFTADTKRSHQHTHVDSASGQASMVPAANGRVDLIDSGNAENYSSTHRSGTRPPVEFAAQHLRVSGHLDALDRDRALPVIRVLARLTGSALRAVPLRNGAESDHAGQPEKHRAPRLDRKSLRELYLAVRGIATGGELTETAEGVRAGIHGHIVGVDRVSLGAGVATPGGTLNAHLAFAVDGITSPEIPPEARQYLPHHIAIQPSISAISLADLDALSMALTAPEREPQDIAARIAALFAHGGITAGLDTFAFDLGAARFSGNGKLTALSPDVIKGEADVKASGFDALIADVQATPALAAALPVLAVIRTYARPEGQDLVWSIRTENADVKVNGRDVTPLLAPGKGDAGRPGK